jgi:hypothetical protein
VKNVNKEMGCEDVRTATAVKLHNSSKFLDHTNNHHHQLRQHKARTAVLGNWRGFGVGMRRTSYSTLVFSK